ncbi:hypothetical protein CEXT_514631 [Caerostris extrusa]|uniref:Uncharacterized protein n=1 Tax=Caerostris extrusa TaxID=172846 RepID=A0AAV4QNI1_CAEEX|nr:hypothetical protein CEXT_514631 [Caerostris extrusa]
MILDRVSSAIFGAAGPPPHPPSSLQACATEERLRNLGKSVKSLIEILRCESFDYLGMETAEWEKYVLIKSVGRQFELRKTLNVWCK